MRVHGKAASGVLPGQTSSLDTTGNTLEHGPSSASTVIAPSLALTTLPFTSRDTRVEKHRPQDPRVHLDLHVPFRPHRN